MEIIIGIIGIICFFFFCGIFTCPSAEEKKKEQEQVAATREIALARLIDHLNQKLLFVNQRSTWDRKYTKNQVEIKLYDISSLVPEFLNDPKLREMVWRKGFSFKRIHHGSYIRFIKNDPPSSDEKYVDYFF